MLRTISSVKATRSQFSPAAATILVSSRRTTCGSKRRMNERRAASALRQPHGRAARRWLLRASSAKPTQRLAWRTRRSSARARPGDKAGSLAELRYRAYLVLVVLEHEGLPKRRAVRRNQHETATNAWVLSSGRWLGQAGAARAGQQIVAASGPKAAAVPQCGMAREPLAIRLRPHPSPTMPNTESIRAVVGPGRLPRCSAPPRETPATAALCSGCPQ